MTDSLDLSAPAPGETAPSPFVLTPPAAVAVIPVEQAANVVPIVDARTAELQKRAKDFTDSVITMDPKDPAFSRKVTDITKLGNDTIQTASQVTNRMLQRPAAALAGAKGKSAGAQTEVADGLSKLRYTVQDLDPSRLDGGLKGALNQILFKNKVRDYFGRYKSAESHLAAIFKSLENGKDSLLKDNAAIEGEKLRLWESMGKIQEYVALVKAMSDELKSRIETVRITDPSRADELSVQLLNPVMAKHRDLLTLQGVSAQSYLALDMVKNNNDQLVLGVERANTTTMAALRTAVIISQALTGQRMVLDQINALNTATENIILGTSQMLKEQTAEIYEEASSSSIGVDTLTSAFQNIYDTIDAVDSYKLKAVETMQTTVDSLTEQLGKASARLNLARPDNNLAIGV
jgi:uncharacterized protein YaaN involved in tellurite resistance